MVEIEIILSKKLEGATSPEEDRFLADWLSESGDHQKYWSDFQQIWQKAGDRRPTVEVDVERALLKVKAARNRGGMQISRRRFLYAAAAAAVLVAAIFVFWPASGPNNAVMIASGQQVLTDTLPDGSILTLNKGTEITQTPGFNQKERRLTLRGEAYFEVQRNVEKPFFVELHDLEIKVVGTAFNVDNKTNAELVLVNVNEGKVQLKAGDQTLVLSAGAAASYHIHTRKIEKLDRPTSNADAWRNRLLKFDETPLSEVFPAVEKAYDVKFEVKNPALYQCKLVVTFDDESLENILKHLEENFPIRCIPDGNRIVVEGDSCNNGD